MLAGWCLLHSFVLPIWVADLLKKKLNGMSCWLESQFESSPGEGVVICFSGVVDYLMVTRWDDVCRRRVLVDDWTTSTSSKKVSLLLRAHDKLILWVGDGTPPKKGTKCLCESCALPGKRVATRAALDLRWLIFSTTLNSPGSVWY